MTQARAQPAQAHRVESPERRQQCRRERVVVAIVGMLDAERHERRQLAHHRISAERARQRTSAGRHLAGRELDHARLAPLVAEFFFGGLRAVADGVRNATLLPAAPS